MRKTVKPKQDVVLSNGIFLRRGAVATVYLTNSQWESIAPIVDDLTPTGVETTAPAEVKIANSENDIQHKPKKGKKQSVEK